MSYHCGVDGSLAKALGVVPGDPRIVCDGCRVTLRLVTRRGTPPAWLLNGRAAPRWEMVRTDGVRRDYCPTCKVTRRLVEPAGTSKEGG